MSKYPNVKQARLMMGMSQEKLAKEAGCSREAIRNIEGGSEPKVGLAIRIANVLGPSVEWLWTNEEGVPE